MILKRALILIGAAVALAGCGSSSESGGEDYPKEARDNFVTACVKTGGGESARERCTCVIDKLEEKVSYEDFKAADTALKENKQPKEEVSKLLEESATECRKEG